MDSPAHRSQPRVLRTSFLTALAMVAFAANSVLCRLALGADAIDAASFSTIRMGSGAAALFVILLLAPRSSGDEPPRARLAGDWGSGAVLFAYAVPFSFAYNLLPAGMGALLLFGAVQLTMIAGALLSGERLRFAEWSGLVIALGGLVYLVSPGLAAPSPWGSLLMITAGVGWGLYTLRGRGADRPVATTAGNLIRCAALLSIASALTFGRAHASLQGVSAAVTSGVLATGIGYAVWYAALRGLTATRASLVQLTVPILAAVGGILFLSETLTLRLVIAAVLVLGGVRLSLAGHLKGVPSK